MIIYQTRQDKWLSFVKRNKKRAVIGLFDTRAEAELAQKEYVALERAEKQAKKASLDNQPCKRELKKQMAIATAQARAEKLEQRAHDMVAKYNRYLEFCVLPKTVTDLRANLDKDLNTAQNTIKSLLRRGYVKSSVVNETNMRKYHAYTTIKLMSYEDAMDYLSPQKYQKKSDAQSEIIPGARVIMFDDDKYRAIYNEQRSIDRKNMKSAKNYASGSTMSSVDW